MKLILASCGHWWYESGPVGVTRRPGDRTVCAACPWIPRGVPIPFDHSDQGLKFVTIVRSIPAELAP